MTNFEKWDKEFREQHLDAFNGDESGLLWLKVRSISRSRQMADFCKRHGIRLETTGLARQNVELFDVMEKEPDAMKMLDSFLTEKGNEWYDAMGVDEIRLKEDLYMIHHYSWGGDRNNSLDKCLVSRYVKVLSKYGDLLLKRDEIAENSWNYVLASWYNNWTSYLIESLFKRHPKVVPSVGEIKSVDFFIGKYPIDLKVTYFPNGYMEKKLKEKLGSKELSWLKRKAKDCAIETGKTATEAQQMYMLTEKLSEHGRTDILGELARKRKEVVEEARQDICGLMRWLYENQGEMKFGAENRLFLILVDSTDMTQSWKMKRSFSLIEPCVKQYLDNFDESSLRRISFTYKGNRYATLADALFVVKQ